MADMFNWTPAPGASTLSLSVTASAHAGVALPSYDTLAGCDYKIFNSAGPGGVICYIGVGATAALAVANAVIGADGALAGGIPTPPGWDVSMTLPAGWFISAIGSAAGPTLLHITAGKAAN